MVIGNIAGGVTVVQAQDTNVLATVAPSLTLQNLGSLLQPDSRISDHARQALRQLVTSALRLGEEAGAAPRREARHVRRGSPAPSRGGAR